MKRYSKAVTMAATSIALALGATAASAADFTVALTPGKGVYTANFGDTVSGAFSDSFTFDLSKLVTTSSVFTITSGSVTASSVISGLKGYLDTPANSFSIAQVGASPLTVDFGSLFTGALSSANHTLYISGTTGTASYGGSITIAATAVPEPATWAMMIVGVGFTGGALRRRAKRDASGLAVA